MPLHVLRNLFQEFPKTPVAVQEKFKFYTPILHTQLTRQYFY